MLASDPLSIIQRMTADDQSSITDSVQRVDVHLAHPTIYCHLRIEDDSMDDPFAQVSGKTGLEPVQLTAGRTYRVQITVSLDRGYDQEQYAITLHSDIEFYLGCANATEIGLNFSNAQCILSREAWERWIHEAHITVAAECPVTTVPLNLVYRQWVEGKGRHPWNKATNLDITVDGTYQRLPDGMPTCLPIIVPLQGLARHLAAAGDGRRAVTAALRAAMASYDVGPVDELLNAALQRGAAMLLFDGLDEVPLQAKPGERVDRLTTLRVVRDFANLYPTTTILMTCRVRAFADDLRTYLGWPVETLAPFTPGQVRHFLRTWYAKLVATNHLSPDTAERSTTILVERVVAHRQLCEMAQTPLLLTMMALVLYNKGGLPRDRPQLYEAILDLLLGQWDKADKELQSLADVIGKPNWISKQILPLLDQLSYAAHQIGSADGRGRLARRDVRDTLISFFQQASMTEADAFAAAGRFLDYIDHRNGLLTPDTDESYVFAHLTVQEHCAGRYIVLGSEDPIALAMRHRADDRWREPLFLGMGLAPPADLNDLLEALLDRKEDEQPKPDARWYRDLILAAEVGDDRDWNYLRTLPRIKVTRVHAALRSGLVVLFSDQSQPLPLAERIHAGILLSNLGDPRVPVTVEEWQQELESRDERFGQSEWYWCYVCPGTYRIGGWHQNQASADISLTAFWIARYPITVAQYAPFVAVGYELEAERWWTQEGWWWKTQQHRMLPNRWSEAPYDGLNQPVIGVTWYEACAFCAWLTEQVQEALPDGYVIRLPTEAEWEIAAAYDSTGQRRRYPWGEAEPISERAIYSETQINYPAPVGICPAGAAACGALDMVGNVWEYTASGYKGYPDKSGELVKDLIIRDNDVPRRGSSWWQDRQFIFCGMRDYAPPDYSEINYGFRVVIAPVTESEELPV